MEIKSISAFITGGASGLGAATARFLLSKGAHVTVMDANSERLAAVLAEFGERANGFAGDVTNPSDVNSALEAATTWTLPLRVAINCAGIGHAERILQKDGSPHSLESFERVIRVNLIGTFNVLRLSSGVISKMPVLESGERGVIINTASIAAFDGQIGQAAYASSKGALASLTLPAARDLAGVGIRVACIAPGIIDTPLLGQLPDEVRDRLAREVPFPKRLGLPEDYAVIAEMIIKSGYINGEVIRVDGALRMPPK